MALYIVQHGKSTPKDQDPQKGLSVEGVSEVRRMAGVAAGYHVTVDQIWHSGKWRARQTAELMAEALAPQKGIKAVDGMNPLDDAARFSDRIDLGANIMLVGHLPFLEKLISQLVIGRLEPCLFHLQNGGVICIDAHPDTHHAVIKWALMPTVGSSTT